jgi:hypothetical protein
MRRRERIRKAGRVLRDPATSEEERRDARALLLREMRETSALSTGTSVGDEGA